MFFRKKSKNTDNTSSPLSKRAKALPRTKKVQFCYMKPDEVNELLAADKANVLSLVPVNYYAEKNKFYQCVLYFNDDFSEIIMQLELYENDRKTSSTEMYEIDKELYAKILMKFGQKVTFD